MYKMMWGDKPLPPKISLRSTVPGSISGQAYRLHPNQAWRKANQLVRAGVPKSTILFDESAPDNLVTLQCEVVKSPHFQDMRFALHSGMGMRQAYEIMRHAQGETGRSLLRTWLDSDSLNQLDWIFENYPDHIIELSAYACNVGVLQWNTLFWEVRPETATRDITGRVPWT